MFKLQTGEVLVETLIVLPIAILLIFVIIQLALIYNAQIIVNYAAYSAARSAIVHENHTVYAKLASTIILSALSKESALLSLAIATKNDNELSVQIIYPFKPSIPIVKDFLSYIPISATCRMKIEN